MRLTLVLIAVAATAAFLAEASQYADRETIIAQAIDEAKEHGKEQSVAREASIQRMKSGRLTSGQVVGRLFKKSTKSARQQGEARVMFEDMVYRAERKLAEAERKAVGSQTPNERAEMLAKELFHKPGSMLTKEELALMNQEAGCSNIRPFPNCFLNIYDLAVRTIDGTCNNLFNPLFGASETAFTRIIPPQYEDGIDALRGDLQARQGDLFPIGPFLAPIPSARIISKNLIFRNETAEEAPFTHILMQWGQFLDHDLDLSPELEAECEGCEFTEFCRPIRVPEEDPAFGVGTLQNGDCLRLVRSLPVCDLSIGDRMTAREQLNALTSFIDGSQVYGSNERVGNAVRAFVEGLLLEGPNFPGTLPSLPIDMDDIVACLNAEDCFLAGDVRANEQVSLTIMHTLWFREHNRIARALKYINPFWNDERLFQEARKIVGSLIQKITYDDYLPKVLGPPTFDLLIGPYFGYDPRIDPGVPNAFATAAYRYGHSLIRPEFARLDSKFMPLAKGPLNLVDAFFAPNQFRESMGTDPIVRGWLVEQSLRADTFINFVLSTQLFANASEGIAGTDLASLNIQRGRDHGLPPFLEWVNYCSRIFPDLMGNNGQFEMQLDLVHFLQTYGSLNDIDLWIGGLAESRLAESFLGPTFACIFGLTFNKVRDGDRFWYENSGVFTPEQLKAIKGDTLSRVICDNTDNIDEIQPDAFLSNQSRIKCDDIPPLDLELWREDSCFVRVEVAPIDQPVILQAFSRVSPVLSFFVEEIQANQQQQFVCMPVACPLSPAGTLVLFSTDAGQKVSFTENSLLAENLNRGGFQYRAVWPEGAFDNELDGIFRSLSACESGDAVALTMSQAGIVQKLEMALDQQNSDVDGLLDFFGNGGDDGKTESETDASEEEMVSDQALTLQLEQALKDLDL